MCSESEQSTRWSVRSARSRSAHARPEGNDGRWRAGEEGRDGTGSLDRVGGSPQGRERKGSREGNGGSPSLPFPSPGGEAGLPPRALPSSPGRAPPLLAPPFPRPSHPPRGHVGMWESQRIASSAGSVRRAPPRALEREAAQMVSKERAPVLEALGGGFGCRTLLPTTPVGVLEECAGLPPGRGGHLDSSRGVPKVKRCAVSKMKIPPSSRVPCIKKRTPAVYVHPSRAVQPA